MSSLLSKLKESQKNIQKKAKEGLNTNSSFLTLSDEEIALVLSIRAKELRIKQNRKQKDFGSSAGLSSTSTYSNFEQKGSISMINFIKVMREFGRLHELESILKLSVKEKIDTLEKNSRDRVR